MTTDKIREKIIAAVPEISERPFITSDKFETFAADSFFPDIRLTDVLRAIGKSEEIHRFTSDVYGETMHFFYDKPGEGTNMVEWNLALPYDEQEPEVKAFIGNVLGVV